MKTFKSFILGFAAPEGPMSDFIGDVKRDPKFPKSKELEWSKYEIYLIQSGACTAAREAAKHLWSNYVKLDPEKEYAPKEVIPSFKSFLVSPFIEGLGLAEFAARASYDPALPDFVAFVGTDGMPPSERIAGHIENRERMEDYSRVLLDYFNGRDAADKLMFAYLLDFYSSGDYRGEYGPTPNLVDVHKNLNTAYYGPHSH